MMNSYFEQGGFYGQAAAASGADPSYRFPLGLAGMGMSPYAQHQPRPQDYDVAAAAAVSDFSAPYAWAWASHRVEAGNTSPSPAVCYPG